MFNPQKILVLAPHTDDGELGCGGTIAKLCAEGKQVYYAAFCTWSVELPDKASNTLELECRKATAALGIAEPDLIFYDYKVRNLPLARQEILQELLELQKKINPDFVLLPAASDIHQDHQVVHQESIRAFKHRSILGYELPWNNLSFSTDYFSLLSEDELEKKVQALRSYESQSGRTYMQEDFTRSLAKLRGVQAGGRYAEAFEVIRVIR
jgi:LmbE family N-acetylglucosaminyl deacetylase